MTYDGYEPLSQIVVTATSGSITGNATYTVQSPPLPTASVNPVYLTSSGQTIVSNITEVDYGGAWTYAKTCDPTKIGITTTASSFSANAVANGSCSVTITDSYGNVGSVPVSATFTTFTLN